VTSARIPFLFDARQARQLLDAAAALADNPGPGAPRLAGQGAAAGLCSWPQTPSGGTWPNLKKGLGNLAAIDVDQLTAIIKNRLKSIQYRPGLIDALLVQARLTLEPEPP
jgi:hypothetical protein